MFFESMHAFSDVWIRFRLCRVLIISKCLCVSLCLLGLPTLYSWNHLNSSAISIYRHWLISFSLYLSSLIPPQSFSTLTMTIISQLEASSSRHARIPTSPIIPAWANKFANPLLGQPPVVVEGARGTFTME